MSGIGKGRCCPGPPGAEIKALRICRLAASELGFTELPCSVKDLGDIEANILLLSSNQQEGNDPLDIGLNALDTVEKSKGGRGVKSELSVSGFARRLGKTSQYMGQVVSAAKVFRILETQVSGFDATDRSKHLYEIHAAPESTWALLAGLLRWSRFVGQDMTGLKWVSVVKLPAGWAAN